MNAEVAIRILERRTTIPDDNATWGEICEAIDMAIATLRAQQTPAKMDRSRWEGCWYCKDAKSDNLPYCPYCGNPLTEDAWAELERRIRGNDDD